MNSNFEISKIKAGDANEFRKLIDEHMDSIYLTALRITANKDDARDIVQDTFMKLWEKRKSINESKSIRSFIMKIAVNKCYDLLRRRKTSYKMNRIIDTALINEIAGSREADYTLNNEEALSVLRSLADGLSPSQRVVFTMVELDELSQEEVAGITGMSKNSVKSNLNHARRKMEVFLKKYLN